MQFNDPDKKESKKWLSLKYAFMVLLKQNEKLKCVMENKGSVAKMIKMRGNNSMLTSKLHILINILALFWWIFMKLP